MGQDPLLGPGWFSTDFGTCTGSELRDHSTEFAAAKCTDDGINVNIDNFFDIMFQLLHIGGKTP